MTAIFSRGRWVKSFDSSLMRCHIRWHTTPWTSVPTQLNSSLWWRHDYWNNHYLQPLAPLLKKYCNKLHTQITKSLQWLFWWSAMSLISIHCWKSCMSAFISPFCLWPRTHVLLTIVHAACDPKHSTPPTKSLWTVLPAAYSTLTLRLFQQVAVRKPLYVNQPNKFCFKGHILYC